MKKILLVLCAVMMMALLLGCYTPGVIDVFITRYPDKLFYIAGQDAGLDLTGGEVTLISGYPLKVLPDEVVEGFLMKDLYSGNIDHDIDFNTPGVYVVTIKFDTDDVADTFEIQVVTQEEYDAMMGPAE
jgi:hypothetical protein